MSLTDDRNWVDSLSERWMDVRRNGGRRFGDEDVFSLGPDRLPVAAFARLLPGVTVAGVGGRRRRQVVRERMRADG